MTLLWTLTNTTVLLRVKGIKHVCVLGTKVQNFYLYVHVYCEFVCIGTCIS